MLEDAFDRRGGSLTIIQEAKLATWERLFFALRLHDAWHVWMHLRDCLATWAFHNPVDM